MTNNNQTQSKPKPPVKSKGKPVLHEVEIIYSGSKLPIPVRISSSLDTVKVLRACYDVRKLDYKEMFYVVLLNKANYCLGVSIIGVGATDQVSVNTKEIFQLALKTNASAIIVSHNHPSGNKEPSEGDKSLTKQVKEGGKLLGITLLDHVIVTSTSYYSFADEGLI